MKIHNYTEAAVHSLDQDTAATCDDILYRAKVGELTPQRAEERARQAGLGPLRGGPPSSRFDPMTARYWTLAMALAWIIWRIPERVREYWDDYRWEFRVWKPHSCMLSEGKSGTGWNLERLNAVSPHDVWRRVASSPDPSAQRATVAQSCLWEKLGTGLLEATGIPRSQETRVSIPKHEWIEISKINFYEGFEDSIAQLVDSAPRYTKVRLERANVLALWNIESKGQKIQENDLAVVEQHSERPTTLATMPISGRRHISKSKEENLPKHLKEYYRNNPGTTREQAKTAIEAQLDCYIPREVWRSALPHVPAQGRPGAKRKG